MRLTIFLLALIWAHFALADHDRGFFAGGNAAYISTESLSNNNEDSSIDITSLELVAGYKYNPWLGIDIRYGTGISKREESVTVTGNPSIVGAEYGIDGYQSVYYRPEITNKEAKLYFLLGYTAIDATVDMLDTNDDVIDETDFSESGTSYGLGAGWFVGDELVINVEYRQLLDKDEDEFSVITFGADYRF